MIPRINIDEVKAETGAAIVLFKRGYQYEAYGNDARTLSAKVGLTIDGQIDGRPWPRVCFPFHHLEAYLNKLVRSGLRVAVCEPSPA